MPGWKIPNPVASLAGLLLAVSAVTAQAGEDDDEVLPAALLEFLADWEDPQGEWQDPMDYADPQWQLPQREAEQNDE